MMSVRRAARVWLLLSVIGFTGCSGKRPAIRPALPGESLSLLGRRLSRPLRPPPPGANVSKLEADLAEARARLAEAPDDPERIVWVGRRLGYLWRINEAIEVYTEGIAAHPNYPPLYRHRGHRYISLRRFDDAIADLERAAHLLASRPDEIEQDGMPNARNIPLTTTGFNVWYHLALARYLIGDYTGALTAYRETMKHTRDIPDNVVAVTDWMYTTLRRLGRHDEAAALLEDMTPDMEIIENHSYHRRIQMYKGLIAPKDLLDVDNASDLDLATLGYGLGAWHLANGDRADAIGVFDKVVAGPYWPAFGFIAAEADVRRLKPNRAVVPPSQED